MTSGGLGVSYTYLQFASQYGNVKIVNPRDPNIDPSIDLLIGPGGPDVDPLRYLAPNVPVSFNTQRPDPIREWFDKFVLPKYIENRTPCFGICRTHQSIAVLMGGTLLQHMYHETNEEKDRRELVHYLHTFIPGEPHTRRVLKINSLHHQVVSKIPEDVANVIGWYASKKEWTLRTKRDQTIEALLYKDYPIASVQWHPEEIYDEFSDMLITDLLLRAEERLEYA